MKMMKSLVSLVFIVSSGFLLASEEVGSSNQDENLRIVVSNLIRSAESVPWQSTEPYQLDEDIYGRDVYNRGMRFHSDHLFSDDRFEGYFHSCKIDLNDTGAIISITAHQQVPANQEYCYVALYRSEASSPDLENDVLDRD